MKPLLFWLWFPPCTFPLSYKYYTLIFNSLTCPLAETETQEIENRAFNCWGAECEQNAINGQGMECLGSKCIRRGTASKYSYFFYFLLFIHYNYLCSCWKRLQLQRSHSQLFYGNPFNLPRVVGWYHWNPQNRPKGALFRGYQKFFLKNQLKF